MMLRFDTAFEPVAELRLALWSDGINPPVRLIPFSKVGVAGNQAGLFQPVQSGVHLGGFDIPLVLTSDHGEQSRPEFVPMPGML